MTDARLARADDLEGIAALVNHFIEHGSQHFGTTPLTVEDVRAFATRDVHPCFVIEAAPGIGRRIDGVAWSAPHKTREAYSWTVDLAVYVHPDAHGARIGSRLQSLVVDCVRRQGYVSALAVISLPNAASVALHERLGFVPIGVLPHVGFKHGQWHDIGIWHLALSKADGRPAAIRSVHQALSSPD